MASIPQSSASKTTPTSVLQSVATITGQRDRDLLAHTLVKTLIELIHCNRITMYRVLPYEHDAEAILVAEAYSHPNHASQLPEVSTIISQRADFNATFT